MPINNAPNVDDLNQILRQNCFKVFDLPLHYKIDQNTLDSKYRTLQKALHPDNFINHPHSVLSIKVSSHINNAYNTLNSPLFRSIELLKQNGIILDLNINKQLPEDFLSEQMSWHEEIEEAIDNAEALAVIETKLVTKQHALNDKIMYYFANENYDAVIDCIKQLAFYNRLENLVNEKIEELW
jgi:molecular chaperone HscB